MTNTILVIGIWSLVIIWYLYGHNLLLLLLRRFRNLRVELIHVFLQLFQERFTDIFILFRLAGIVRFLAVLAYGNTCFLRQLIHHFGELYSPLLRHWLKIQTNEY